MDRGGLLRPHQCAPRCAAQGFLERVFRAGGCDGQQLSDVGVVERVTAHGCSYPECSRTDAQLHSLETRLHPCRETDGTGGVDVGDSAGVAVADADSNGCGVHLLFRRGEPVGDGVGEAVGVSVAVGETFFFRRGDAVGEGVGVSVSAGLGEGVFLRRGEIVGVDVTARRG